MLLSDGAGSYGEIPEAETQRLAKPLLQRALELAPLDAQILGVYGLLEANDYNTELALGYYQKSVALNPSSGEVLNWQRMAQISAGLVTDAVETNMRMVEIDPMSMVTLWNGVLGVMAMEEHDQLTVEMMVQRLEGLDKSYGLSARGAVAERAGNIPAAAKYYYLSMELNPGRSSNRSSLANLLARLGLAKEALLVAPEEADNIAFFSADWETALKMQQEDFDAQPDSANYLFGLFMTLAMSGDAEAAFPYAEQLWKRFGDNPSQLGRLAFHMSWVANKTEHAQQARLYRDAGAEWLQTLIEAGVANRTRYFSEAALAAIDGRIDDAIAATKNLMEKGGRWHYINSIPIFDTISDSTAFQAQVSRMNDQIASERSEILAMLCGPETILTSWKSAPETCELYQQELSVASG